MIRQHICRLSTDPHMKSEQNRRPSSSAGSEGELASRPSQAPSCVGSQARLWRRPSQAPSCVGAKGSLRADICKCHHKSAPTFANVIISRRDETQFGYDVFNQFVYD